MREARQRHILHTSVPQEYQEVDLKFDVIRCFDKGNEEGIRDIISLGNLATRVQVKGTQEGLPSICQKSALTKLMSESLQTSMSLAQQTESVQRWLPVLMKEPVVLDTLLTAELKLVSDSIDAASMETSTIELEHIQTLKSTVGGLAFQFRLSKLGLHVLKTL